MKQPTVGKMVKRKLKLTPQQEQELEGVLAWRWQLYNMALEQRIAAWQRRHVALARFEQEAELKDSRAAFPEYEAIHSHVLQDVLVPLMRALRHEPAPGPCRREA
jgi:putative transposase